MLILSDIIVEHFMFALRNYCQWYFFHFSWKLVTARESEGKKTFLVAFDGTIIHREWSRLNIFRFTSNLKGNSLTREKKSLFRGGEEEEENLLPPKTYFPSLVIGTKTSQNCRAFRFSLWHDIRPSSWRETECRHDMLNVVVAAGLLRFVWARKNIIYRRGLFFLPLWQCPNAIWYSCRSRCDGINERTSNEQFQYPNEIKDVLEGVASKMIWQTMGTWLQDIPR